MALNSIKDKGLLNRTVVTDHMVLIGFGLAVIYWLLDSFLSLFLSYDNFLEKALGVKLNNVWGRLIVLCLFAIFGSHAQFTMNERKKAAEKMERDAATREKFRRLLSPDLAEMVVNGQLLVRQGGESRVVTVMFVDIRGFTAISNQVEATQLLSMLNSYFELLVEIVFRYEGTVDKFMGDGMMVIWGAPVSHDDDPVRAVRAARDIQRAMENFNFDRAARGAPPIEVGIGINTGPVVAGYIGSSRTMSYSVIGDTVNVASRLCAAALPGEVVLSEYTQFIIQDEIKATPRTPIHAKGMAEPIQAYSVLFA
ncbi:MAG: adenylate/guanylate cyclase domain-containing protein [Desulfobacteraceae bacterium]|nr:adenylate/guanylate cyclase domain-containing protein [Desulfobacteraceae bacterium]